jgi:Big-like domain-containing protein
MGLKKIAPGETVTIDIRALRDSQVLDDEGRTVPADVAHGQVRWTLIQSKGTDPLALIGRAEQVDEVKAISSTYACQNCCGDFFTGVEIIPFSAQIQVGQSVTMRAFEIRNDCYGYSYPVEQTASWNSSNPSVATVSGGQVTSTGAGQATITATWNSYSSIPTQCGGSGVLPGPIGGCCGAASFFRSASANVTVQTVEVGSISPETMNVSTGDDASAHTLNVNFTPTNSTATINFRIIFLHNVGGSQQASLAVPSRTGTSPISTTVKAAPAGGSGGFVVQPSVGTSVSPRESRVIVPPQILLQMMRNEARGLSSTTVRSLIGWALRNRFNDSQFFASQTSYQAAITAGATIDIRLIKGEQPELDSAAGVFDGFIDTSQGSQGFWSPTPQQWQTVQTAMGSSTLPANVGAPGFISSYPRQYVYFPSVGDNPIHRPMFAPSFLFVRKRPAGQPAVVQINN